MQKHDDKQHGYLCHFVNLKVKTSNEKSYINTNSTLDSRD